MNETAKTLVANGSLSAPSARISNQEALALAKTRFDIEGRVKRFDTEKDDTFRLTSRDGRNYTLKIANAAEDPREISFQIDLLAHIAAVDPGLPVPRVVPDRDCRLQFSYADSAGQQREVHLLTYLEGVPLSEVTTDAREREKVGEVLGTLRLATADYSHAADSREIAWDVKHLLKLAPLLGEIEDPARRGMIEAGLDRFASIADRLAKCRIQVLHNDFSKSNIVVDKSDANFVTGVIDFGDAVRTAVVIDVSTAILNQLPSQGSEDFFASGCDLLRGYLRVADLTDEELSLLPHLVMARVVARALLTIWRARLFPDNAPYIMRNTDQGWQQLAWFMARSMDRISNEFMVAAR
jgi:hydroxylysine kinase